MEQKLKPVLWLGWWVKEVRGYYVLYPSIAPPRKRRQAELEPYQNQKVENFVKCSCLKFGSAP